MDPGNQKPPLVSVRNLCRSYDHAKVSALRGVNLTVSRGEFVAITGPSGSGKSTLLNILGGLDLEFDGDATFEGEDLHKLADPAAFRARAVGLVFQSFHLLPTLTALENVQLPMFEMPWSAAARRQRAAKLLESLGLAERMDHLPSELSGGERQRVAIARSLANAPRLLLADEPTGNLDTATARNILELLREIHAEGAITILTVTHDPQVASQAQRILHLIDGKIVREDGKETLD